MIQWMENFQIYSPGSVAAQMRDGLWASASFAENDDPDPNITGIVPRFGASAIHGMSRVLATPQTTVGIAQRVWPFGLPASVGLGGTIMHFRDSNNATQIFVAMTPIGGLAVYRGYSSTLIGQTAGPVITSSAWSHIECRVVLASTATGSVQIRVEGVTVLNLTNVITQATAVNNIQIVAFGGAVSENFHTEYAIKDIVVWDGTGTRNNNFLGSVSVITLRPNGDVSSGWTTVGGASPSGAIDDVSPNDDTDYIQAGTGPIPAATIVELSNLPVNVTSIRALQPTVRARKIDGGDGNIQMGMVSGGSTGLGANRPITSAYTYWFDISEVDPATSNNWLPAAVDAARLQINRTL